MQVVGGGADASGVNLGMTFVRCCTIPFALNFGPNVTALRVEPDSGLSVQCTDGNVDAGQLSHVALDGRTLDKCPQLPCEVQLGHVKEGAHTVSSITTCIGAWRRNQSSEADLAFEVRLLGAKLVAQMDESPLTTMKAVQGRSSL